MQITFTASSNEFISATNEYFQIWQTDGQKITEILNKLTQLPEPQDFEAIIYEGISRSGNETEPMYLRASYSDRIKIATLIHELGHRYLLSCTKRPSDVDEHYILFLFLYDVWDELYGEAFANEMVHVEKGRKGTYDYETAWNNILTLTKGQRQEKFETIRKMNKI